MFKNLTVQTRIVRTKKSTENVDDATVESVDPVEIVQIVAETAIKTVGAVACILAANKVLSTVCDISVIVTKAKLTK